LSLSLTLTNFVVYGHSSIHAFGIFNGINIIHSCQFCNNEQDTTKINSDKVLFGRAFLKSHYELHGKKAVVDDKKRNEWISKTVDSLMLKNESDFPCLVINELVHEDFYQASYRLIKKGMIKFEDGSYVKMVSTSAHATTEIGDITLAVNERGDVYVNQGHICGTIIHFNTHQKGLTRTAATFLRDFSSDTDDEQWQLHTQDQNKKTNKQKF
jgi:hypothetical protein